MDDPELGGEATRAKRDDPDATRLADPDATVLTDPNATQLAAPPSPEGTGDTASDDMPTIVVPHAVSSGEGPDGIDAMDDPYAPINDADFTRVTPYAPMAIDSPVTANDKHRSRVHPLAVVLVVVALLAAAAFVVKYTYVNEYWGGKTLPDVVGKTETEARSTLSPLGFTVNVNEVLSDDNVGKVISMDPVAGTRTGDDLSVTITVAVARTIPSVVGLIQADAKTALYNVVPRTSPLHTRTPARRRAQCSRWTPARVRRLSRQTRSTLTVAQPFKVPDVVGLTLSDAEKAIEAAGLAHTVSYTDEKGEENAVVSTSPEAGTEVSEGSTVTLYVPSPKLTDAYHLAEYFDIDPADLDAYLTKQGYSVSSTGVFPSGNAYAVYSDGTATITITDYPSPQMPLVPVPVPASLTAGKAVGGVRLQASASAVSSSAAISSSGISAVMDACGLSNLVSSCTADTTQTTRTIDKTGLSFISGYGQQGNYVWSILIGSLNGSSTHVVVTIASKSHYDGIDLSDYGNDLASYIAITNYYGK